MLEQQALDHILIQIPIHQDAKWGVVNSTRLLAAGLGGMVVSAALQPLLGSGLLLLFFALTAIGIVLAGVAPILDRMRAQTPRQVELRLSPVRLDVRIGRRAFSVDPTTARIALDADPSRGRVMLCIAPAPPARGGIRCRVRLTVEEEKQLWRRLDAQIRTARARAGQGTRDVPPALQDTRLR